MEASIGTEDAVCQASTSTTTAYTEATRFNTTSYKDEVNTSYSTCSSGIRQEESSS